VLAALAAEQMQIGQGASQFFEQSAQPFAIYRRVALQPLEGGLLSLQILQQFAPQLRAGHDVHQFEEGQQGGVVGAGIAGANEIQGLVKQVLEAQPSAHPFVEGKFELDQGSRHGLLKSGALCRKAGAHGNA